MVKRRCWYPVHTRHWSKSLWTSVPVWMMKTIRNAYHRFYLTLWRWVFLLHFFLIGVSTVHNICQVHPFQNTSHPDYHLIFSFFRLLYPQLKHTLQALLSRNSSTMLSHHPSFLLLCQHHLLDVPQGLCQCLVNSFIAERPAWILTMASPYLYHLPSHLMELYRSRRPQWSLFSVQDTLFLH